MLVLFLAAVFWGLCKHRTTHHWMPAGAPALSSVRTAARTQAIQRKFLPTSTASCISPSWEIPLEKGLPLTVVRKRRAPAPLPVAAASCPGAGEVLKKRQNWEVLWTQMLHTSSWEVQELNMALKELSHEWQLCAEGNLPSSAVLVCSV